MTINRYSGKNSHNTPNKLQKNSTWYRIENYSNRGGTQQSHNCTISKLRTRTTLTKQNQHGKCNETKQNEPNKQTRQEGKCNETKRTNDPTRADPIRTCDLDASGLYYCCTVNTINTRYHLLLQQ